MDITESGLAYDPQTDVSPSVLDLRQRRIVMFIISISVIAAVCLLSLGVTFKYVFSEKRELLPLVKSRTSPIFSTDTTAISSETTGTETLTTTLNTRWAQDGVTIAGGHGDGNGTHQFYWPCGFFMDDDRTMVIADFFNHRIVQWKMNATEGQVVAGGNDQGNRLDQLFQPTDVLIDNDTNSLVICDFYNRRVVLWSRHNETTQGEIFLDNIVCFALTMDDQKFLYVSDGGKHEVRRYRMGDKNGTLVAGGHGQGEAVNQLNGPTFIFVDRQHAVYVSDWGNLRVMRWDVGAEEGILVAGGHGIGNGPRQLWHPEGLFVDILGNLYVSDKLNQRVMLWPKDARQGILIAGGNGEGKSTDQLNGPRALSFDRYGNLYIVDEYNSRIQRFSLE